jgi:hypothetical protein
MKSEVTNTSGGSRFFAWVPPHGRLLTDGQKVDLHGDLRSVLAGGRNRYSQKINLQAMDADLVAGRATLCTSEETCWASSSHYPSSLEA